MGWVNSGVDFWGRGLSLALFFEGRRSRSKYNTPHRRFTKQDEANAVTRLDAKSFFRSAVRTAPGGLRLRSLGGQCLLPGVAPRELLGST